MTEAALDGRPTLLLGALLVAAGTAPALAIVGADQRWVSLAGTLSLISLSLSIWARRERAAGTGFLALFPFIYAAVYTFGSIPLPGIDPFFRINIDLYQWLLYGLGLAAWLSGTFVMQGLARRRPSIGEASRSSLPRRTLAPSLAVGAGLIAILGFTANFATAGIPLFAGDINAVRFGEHSGPIPKLVPFFVAFGQFSLLYLASVRLLNKRRLSPTARIVVTGVVVCFVLTASRAFLALPVLAIILLVFEYRLLGARKLSAIILAALTVLVLGGSLRNGTSQFATGPAATSSKVPIVGPLLDTLQFGPHAFAAVRLRIPDTISYQHGSWAARDAALLLRTHEEPADLWITDEVLGRDASRNGGLPPTMVGGLYVDGGPFGVALGMFLVGAFTVLLVRRAARQPRRSADALMVCFWGAYLLTSFYGYLSLKTNVILVLGLGILASQLEGSASSDSSRS